MFQQWDITITEHMVKHLEGKFAERRLTTKRLQEAEESKYVVEFNIKVLF